MQSCCLLKIGLLHKYQFFDCSYDSIWGKAYLDKGNHPDLIHYCRKINENILHLILLGVLQDSGFFFPDEHIIILGILAIHHPVL